MTLIAEARLDGTLGLEACSRSCCTHVNYNKHPPCYMVLEVGYALQSQQRQWLRDLEENGMMCSCALTRSTINIIIISTMATAELSK